METAPPPAASPAAAALHALRVLQASGGLLYTHALLHAQLARVDWQEEKGRLLRMLLVLLLGFACLLCALLFAGGLVLAATWETPYRLPALAALAVLFGGGTVLAWRRFQALLSLGSQAFEASRAELAADVALLKDGL